MKVWWFYIASGILLCEVHCYWDAGTTTAPFTRSDTEPRESFFRWMWVYSAQMRWWYWNWDWYEIEMRRRLYVVAGLSIDKLCITTGTLLNRRTVITAANPIDPFAHRTHDLRIWALGRGGYHNTPWRYRVWRATRVFPKSLNPEHWHGPRGVHSPRHDICIVHSWDQIYLYNTIPWRYLYAFRQYLCGKHHVMSNDMWTGGSGYEYLEHIKENYKIFWATSRRWYIMDCSKYLPKWWGKFICLTNYWKFSGVQDGMGLYDGSYIVGLGCFDIRYNEERILAFTDIRYYIDHIYYKAHHSGGEYYEYAYPHFFVKFGTFYDSMSNDPTFPAWYIQYDVYPMGKRK